MDWQPIETAPRDGTEVFLFAPDYEDTPDERFGVGRFDPYCCKGAGCWDAPVLYGRPTHWLPLPTPPLAPVHNPSL